MQSGEGAPTISLQLVPKMLAPLVSLWVPHAFVVSFKLETDENLLIPKARDSLNKYKHKVSGLLEYVFFFIFLNWKEKFERKGISFKKFIKYSKFFNILNIICKIPLWIQLY